jgi:hypothetical protein
MDFIFQQSQRANQYCLTSEFVKVPAKDLTGIARPFQDFLCIAPFLPADLAKAKKAHLARSPSLVLMPDFFSYSTQFVNAICEKLGDLPNVQIGVCTI